MRYYGVLLQTRTPFPPPRTARQFGAGKMHSICRKEILARIEGVDKEPRMHLSKENQGEKSPKRISKLINKFENSCQHGQYSNLWAGNK